MFTVLKPFKDKLDNSHMYNVGDVYPREGAKKPTKKRIAELSTDANAAGYQLIEELILDEDLTEAEDATE